MAKFPERFRNSSPFAIEIGILYLKCGERYEDIVDYRSCVHSLSSCEMKASFFRALISQLLNLCT